MMMIRMSKSRFILKCPDYSIKSKKSVLKITKKLFSSKKKNYKLETLLTLSEMEGDPYVATSIPLYQTATFNVMKNDGKYDYTRSGNPTRDVLQNTCAAIEDSKYSFAFNSGMAALTASLRLLKPGDVVLACEDIYGGMHRELLHCAKTSGLNIHFIKTWEIEEVKKSMNQLGRVNMLCVESPTNPQMKVSDIRALAKLTSARDAYLLVDNSVMTPLLSKPLELGADIVVHSATKYISGHSDVMAGIAACNSEDIAAKLSFVQNAEGIGLAPFDSWLTVRGLKTMALRFNAAQKNTVLIYEYLCNHPNVIGINYLVSPNENRIQVDSRIENEKRSLINRNWQNETQLHYAQATGGGALLSFEMESPEIAKKVIENCKIFKNTVSFGNTSSLIEIPCEMSHASIPKEMQTMSPALIRLAIGIEDSGDLIRDLSQAITKAVHVCNGTKNKKELKKTMSHSFPLGQTLPANDIHAVGVSMPLWEDVVAYEEGLPAVHNKLLGGYPRFVFLHGIKRLFEKARQLFANEDEDVMVFPSARVALRFQEYLNVRGTHCHDLFAHGAFAVTFPKENFAKAKSFWQHTGEIPSSRLAAAIIELIDRTCYENAHRVNLDEDGTLKKSDDDYKNDPSFPSSHTSYDQFQGLKKRISTLTNVDENDIYLHPTGMSAISSTQRLLKLSTQWEHKPLRTAVFGFPYLDSLKLARLPIIGSDGCVFYGFGNEDDFKKLEKMLESERISGLFVEFPSNPLLKAPDLERLLKLGDKYNFPVIVDDSCVGFSNVNFIKKGGADIVVTSLTKQFAGVGNVMGGSLMLNKYSKFYNRLKSRLARDYEPLLYKDDAKVLLQSSSDLESRVQKSNTSAISLVNHLSVHPDIQSVYHPSTMNTQLYEKFMRNESYSGYGALFSLVFKDPMDSKTFFNKLDLAKGPGFGTNFSLLCPYTVIAHYNELDWAKKYGVDPNLVRVWIGQEDERELLAKFDYALEK